MSRKKEETSSPHRTVYELNNLSKSSSTFEEASVVTISGSFSVVSSVESDGFKKLLRCPFNSSKVGAHVMCKKSLLLP